METKRCTKCGVEKHESEFAKNKTLKDGLSYYCKKCLSEYSKKYRVENYENVKEKEKKYRVENRDKVKSAVRKWQEKNKEKTIETIVKWQKENKEKTKEYHIKWSNKNQNMAYYSQKQRLKKQIGETPPPELVEVKLLINKTKRLCKTLKN